MDDRLCPSCVKPTMRFQHGSSICDVCEYDANGMMPTVGEMVRGRVSGSPIWADVNLPAFVRAVAEAVKAGAK